MTKHWLITDKGDPDALRIVDGHMPWGKERPHYSRQSEGSRQFTRNGQNLVFISQDSLSVWVSFRPTPGKATRADGLDAWECAIFCKRGGDVLASELITEAVTLTYALCGPAPIDGFITFVKPSAVRSVNPGYCYKKAGWRLWGQANDGKPRLRAPWFREMFPGASIPDWGDWEWKEGRGGAHA